MLGLISPEAALIESPAGAEKVPPEKLPVPLKVTVCAVDKVVQNGLPA